MNISNIQIHTASNNARYATYTIEGKGNACTFIPKSCEGIDDVAQWLNPIQLIVCKPANGRGFGKSIKNIKKWGGRFDAGMKVWLVRVPSEKVIRFFDDTNARWAREETRGWFNQNGSKSQINRVTGAALH